MPALALRARGCARVESPVQDRFVDHGRGVRRRIAGQDLLPQAADLHPAIDVPEGSANLAAHVRNRARL